MWVAVDASSGDHGESPIVHGSILAAKELGAHVILVGNSEKIEPILREHPEIKEQIQVEHTTEVIRMDESPAMAVRSKKNASVNIAASLVASGRAVGFFSPGNTGASMAAALKHLGRIPGVKRPAIATPIPRESAGATVLIDAGANVDSKPEYLVQFAIMGEVYAREILGVINPKLGLLSNGEEEGKGNELTSQTFPRLAKLPYDFTGNVEGKDLFGMGRPVDVVVCDGFTGNITLKSIEAAAKSIFSTLKHSIRESSLAKTGALFLKPAFQAVRSKMDYASHGGAPLLGVDGIAIIGHGSSSAWAVRNAIRVTLDFARNDVIMRLRENIRRFA